MKMSIRSTLVIGILLLIWGTQFLGTSSSYISSQRVLLRHAGDIMKNISDFTIEQAKNHLSLAQGAAHLTKRLLAAEVVGSGEARETLLEQYFLDQLAIYPHFAGIYLGAPDGSFHYVSRNDAVPGSAFRTKRIETTDGQRTVTLIWRDENFNEIRRESTPDDPYDPRSRPWYKKAIAAKKIVWTDPYIFFTSQKPGITIAGPFYAEGGKLRGIVGVDIEIDQLSTFIARLEIGKTGKAYMLNNNGDVVAFPDLAKLKYQEGENQGIRLARIEEIDDILSQKAFGSVTWQYDRDHRILLNAARHTKFEHEERIYHVIFSPFSDRQWPWIMCVYLPENDYLGEIKDNRRMNIYITVGISILATLLGLYLARGMTRPIGNLEREAQAVKSKDLTTRFDTRSIYKEIQETADSFARMKESLIEYERENTEFNLKLKASQEKYRSLYENAVEGIFEMTPDGRFLNVNRSMAHILGYASPHELLADITDIARAHFGDPESHRALLAELAAKERVIEHETRILKRDLSEITASISIRAVKNDKGVLEHYEGSLLDITASKEKHRAEKQRRLMEEALRESEEKYRTLVESMEDAVYMVDRNSRYLSVNNRFLIDFNMSKKECIGKTFGELHGPRESFRFSQQINAVFETGKASQFETYDRTLAKWLLLTLSPVHAGDNGRVEGVTVVAKDITDRVQAEQELIEAYERLKQTQEQLIQNAKMAAIGQLAAAIARQFNEPLDRIMEWIDDPETHSDKPVPIEFTKRIRDFLQRTRNITGDILLVAGTSDFERHPLDICELLHETIRVSGHGQGSDGAPIHTDFPPQGMQVLADQPTLKQVFLHLLANAMDATAGGGEIFLRVYSGKALEPGESIDHRTLGALNRKNRAVVVEVADTGIGIDAETLPHVFDPFFSTKGEQRGTGIGLSIAQMIIDRHKGTIDIENLPEGGTRVVVKLPPSDETAL
jgi:two-component system cell cycle sensor histidine kinase/response regulator CckA